MTDVDEPIKTDPCLDFLSVLLAELGKALSVDP
jgi:hypothetical protein